MKCIAIDDEPIALEIITQYCNRYGNIQLETFSSPLLGMQRIKETHPEIVFLDIEMNGTSGIELAKELPPECCLIFTTAFAQYAVDGFEANAVDFLHKPYFYDRFRRALDKAVTQLRMNQLLSLSESPERRIVLKVEYKNVTVSLDEILYIEAMDNYVKLFRAGKPTVVSQISMKNIEKLLPKDEFLRVHRSFIVAKNKISKYSKQQIELTHTDAIIPVGKKYAAKQSPFS